MRSLFQRPTFIDFIYKVYNHISVGIIIISITSDDINVDS